MELKEQSKDALIKELRRLRVRNHELERQIARCEIAGTTPDHDVLRKAIFDAIPAMIWVKDAHNNILYANKQAAESIGRSIAEVEGQSTYDLYPEEDARKYLQDDIEVIKSGKPKIGIIEHYHPSGRRRRWVSTNKVPFRGDAGNIIGVIVVAVDVTDQTNMKEELQKMQKLDSLGILAGGIAHDFNNILSGILGNISLVRTEIDDRERVLEHLARAEAASWEAHKLTRQLLTFATGGKPARKPMLIQEFLRDMINFPLAGSTVKSHVIMAANLWGIEVDEAQFRQLINNLIINAAQAMPRGGTVTVVAENYVVGDSSDLPISDGKYLKISIQDQGPGIPAEEQPRIFDPFYTTKATGNGLGLAIVYSIIRRHDGFITVESATGHGATFLLYLPATTSRAEPPQPTTTVEGPGPFSAKILVMDDEKFIRDFVATALAGHGCVVETAADGADAISLYKDAMAAGTPFDAVILDLTVPGGLGGKATIKQLLTIDPKISAIVTSGYSNDPIMADYQAYGFKSAIGKPYKQADLMRIVHSVVCSGSDAQA